MNAAGPRPVRFTRLAWTGWIALSALACAVATSILIAQQGENDPGTSLQRTSPTPGWVDSVTTGLRASEYEFSLQPDGTLSAPNRVHALRTRIDDGGVRVIDRIRGAAGFELQLTLAAYGRGASIAPLDAGRASSLGERAEIERGDLVEWFINEPRGLEHGFTLAKPPVGAPGDESRQVVLSMQLGGNVLVHPDGEDGAAVLFRDPSGEPILRYGGLRVTDARNRELPARLVPGFGELRIEFDDQDALYPVTVDPLLTLAVWTAEGNQASASFGIAVAAAGDVNGDGFSDVLVGAEFYDNGEADEGRALVYAGSASGPSTTALWTGEPNQAGASYGRSVAAAGDVNNDGFGDVLVGAWLYDNGQNDEGRAFLYLGSAGGPSVSASWTAESNQADARYAYSVSGAGDVNGDGFSDLVVGAWFYDNGQADEGRVFAYHGGASGPSLTAAWTAEADQAGAGFGSAVASAGDVNADGFADVVIGARAYDNGQSDEGRAYVYLGSASGLTAAAGWTAESDQANALYGVAVAGAGDVNGDGYADVLVGSHFYDNGQTNEGRTFVYHGSASGPSPAADWTAEPNQAIANFGISVGSAGDVNGDGYADVIVGAWFDDNVQTDEGRAYAYQGSPAGLSVLPSWITESNQDGAEYGAAVAGVGDVNGDGYSDVIVGAPLFDNVEIDEGRAYVFLGAAAGLSTTVAWRAEPDQASAALATSVASAGDVNGDGFSDVIVSAPTFDNGEADEGRALVFFGSSAGLALTASWTAEPDVADARFGASVAAAGDVNGDGYADVIVGASRLANGEVLEGRAYAYSGSASGLEPTPAWTFESNRAGALAGSSVAGAGDVNGDGYADVVVGAPGWSNGQSTEGSALVFFGSPAGLVAAPSWMVESNQIAARMGTSVVSAGDLNRDGFTDVAVGVPLFDGPDADEGRVLVYAGSASGPALTASWTLEANQTGAEYGATVAAGGDVNSDGFADLLVGAYKYDNGATDEGIAFLYSGGPTGLTGAVAWSVESNQAGASFGYAVASAGDVNGDGFGDVIVGAIGFDNVHIDEGRVLTYLGSAAGLATNAAWAVEANQNGAQLGFSVAGAGDVNGDGFSDVIVGAPSLDNGSTDEGTAFVYYGNDRGGAARIPSQARASGAAPIAILGLSEVPTAFRVRQLGRSAAGSSRIRLEIEVKPRGTPLNGSGTVLSSFQTLTPAGGAAIAFDESIGGLTASTGYAWRARIRSAETLVPRSPWFGMPDNAIRLVDFRTSCSSPVTYYRDADGDGWGNPAVSVGACIAPSGYTTQLSDCDDARASSFPGGTETCNGFDDDCDIQVDEGLGTITCGVGPCQSTADACQGGGPGTCVPGTPGDETCNNVDDDCDGSIDDDLGYTSCGQGACLLVVLACFEGAPLPCEPLLPNPESCNNIDDDCDGFVDNMGLTTCGVGACRQTVDNCTAGVPQICTPGSPAQETCEGTDEDCDGSVDEELGFTSCGVGACLLVVDYCFAGSPQPCTPFDPTAETCNDIDDDCDGVVDDLGESSCGIGACARTEPDCVAGAPHTCTPGSPAQETCNGADDDCDASVDEELGFTSCGVGACLLVVDFCYNGSPQPCVPFEPTPETCNNIDDDCDGAVDGIGESSCGVGACARTVPNCDAGVPQTCVPGTPAQETCNGADDDCDGGVDEELGSTSCGLGACRLVVDFCFGGSPQPCDPFPPTAETCNGIDDDCDGAPDDLGQTTCGVGSCQVTVSNCLGGAVQTCTPLTPQAETCNGADDDCNGTVDDLGQTSCGVGRCSTTVDNCSNGTLRLCVPFDPLDERCNGLDDDCDGETDEGFGQTTCGEGPCQRTVDNCLAGAPQTCVPVPPTSEACNGLDDDCDGTIDDISILVSGLRFRADRTSIEWVAESGATDFDVVKGDLDLLRSSAGDFTASLLTCFSDADPASAVIDSELPEAGTSWYYLVRSTNCMGVTGSYDTVSPKQMSSRDPGINSAAVSCP